MNARDRSVGRRGALLGAVAWTLLICWITLRPVEGEPEELLRFCLVCGELGVPNIVLNILLYVPLGLSLRSLFGSTWTAVAAATSLSLGVEVAQLWIPGRHTGAVDLVSNSLGAVTGALLAARHSVWLRPSPRARIWLTASWVLFVASWLAFFPVAMRLSVPSGQLFAQWTPELGTLEAYTGRVVRARVGPIDVPHGALTGSEDVRALLRTGGPVRVRMVVGRRTSSLAPILRLVDGVGNEAFQLGVDHQDLVVRFRYRADDLKMARPDVRLRGVFDNHPPGDTVLVSVEAATDGGYHVTIGERAAIHTVVGAARSWSLLRYPSGMSARGLTVLDAAWSTALFLPLGFWAASWVAAVGLAVLPVAALLTSVHLSQVVTIGVGSLLTIPIGVLLGGVLRSLMATSCRDRATLMDSTDGP